MKEIQLTLLIGQYAQRYYLKKRTETNLTETVRNFRNHLPQFLLLPYPSTRNNIWLKKNPWFEQELVPKLQAKISFLLK